MLFFLPPRSVSAQCGSQASSCKNCHETQAQDPVNNDGTAWHTQHAFGDFCYLCHAGNNQATDKVAAHTGLVSPLADIDASCKSCHPNDTLTFAQTYAATLGQTIGTGGSSFGKSACSLQLLLQARLLLPQPRRLSFFPPIWLITRNAMIRLRSARNPSIWAISS